MKIAFKISLTIIFLSLLLSFVSGYLIFNFTKSALQSTTSLSQIELARETMSQIDRILYERYLDIQDLADSVIIQKYFQGQATEADVNLRLKRFFNTSGPWDVLKVVDSNGQVIFSSQKSLVGQNVNQSPNALMTFNQSINGTAFISDVLISDDTGNPTIYFSSPLRQSGLDQKISAVVIGQFSWPTIEEIVSSVGDRDTHIHLYSSINSLIAGNNHDQSSANIQLLGQKSSGVFSGFLITQASQIGYLNYQGSGWKLVIEKPTSAAFALAAKNAEQVVIIYVPIVLISSLILFFLINQLFIVPLKDITQIANDIANGKIHSRATVSSDDEIGQLAKSLNQMTDQLLDTQSQIEKKVSERTSELEKINQFMVNRELRMIELKKEISRLKQTINKL